MSESIISELGVSVVICAHNSAQRLSQTLGHLVKQQVETKLPWEVIVVDNASSDDTTKIAKSILTENQIAPFQVVHEPQLGLSHARHRGLECSNYEFVSFVDDDNWVNPHWVQTVFTIMTELPEVGACGGLVEAAFEGFVPSWFNSFQDSYAVGKQAEASGYVDSLWGAGITLRKSAWNHLRQNGYQALLTGRKGASLVSGEDTELCWAFRLAGWRIWYDERLKLQHFMPSARLQWSYLCRLHRGFGTSSVGLDPYRFAYKGNPAKRRGRLGRVWASQAHTTFRALLKHSRRVMSDQLRSAREGNQESLRVEWLVGRLTELLRRRDAYDQSIMEIWSASWKRVSS